MGVWGSFFVAAAALKTFTRNGFNAQGVNLTIFPWTRWALRRVNPRMWVLGSVRASSQAVHAANAYRLRFQVWTLRGQPA